MEYFFCQEYMVLERDNGQKPKLLLLQDRIILHNWNIKENLSFLDIGNEFKHSKRRIYSFSMG